MAPSPSRCRGRRRRRSEAPCPRSPPPSPATGDSSTRTRSHLCPPASASRSPRMSRCAAGAGRCHECDRCGGARNETLTWEVRHGTILRLHQLLAQTGYLPVDWSSSGDSGRAHAAAQVAAVVRPPAGHFSWPYAATTPKELKGIWRTFEWNEITRGAVMMFEHDHDLEVDAFVGPEGLARAARGCTRRQAPNRRIQLRLRAPQRAPVADAVARRKDDPHLPRQHRCSRRTDRARHLPGLRAHPGRDDVRHEPRRHALQRSRASAGSATSTTARRSTRSRARASARRRASAASSSRSPPPRRSGPTPRSGRSSRRELEV